MQDEKLIEWYLLRKLKSKKTWCLKLLDDTLGVVMVVYYLILITIVICVCVVMSFVILSVVSLVIVNLNQKGFQIVSDFFEIFATPVKKCCKCP